jgi:hypothetical protein
MRGSAERQCDRALIGRPGAETFEVRADGELLTSEPVSFLPPPGYQRRPTASTCCRTPRRSVASEIRPVRRRPSCRSPSRTSSSEPPARRPSATVNTSHSTTSDEIQDTRTFFFPENSCA